MPPPTTPFAEVDGRGAADGNPPWGATGCRSLEALVAWKPGGTPRNAETMVAVARRLDELPRLARGLRAGRLSLDRVKMEPRPEPKPEPEQRREITSYERVGNTTFKIRLKLWRRRSSRPDCSPTRMRWSPTGDAIPTPATAMTSRPVTDLRAGTTVPGHRGCVHPYEPQPPPGGQSTRPR